MPTNQLPFVFTAIVSRPSQLPYPVEKWHQILQSIATQQFVRVRQILVLSVETSTSPTTSASPNPTPDAPSNETPANFSVPIKTIVCPNYGACWKQAIEWIENEDIVWINATQPVFLQQSACCALKMAMLRDPQAGMVYGDYTLLAANGPQEINLLDYHPGRLRDNLDLGFVFGITNVALRKTFVATDLQYAFAYDLRLRIDEQYHIQHIGNRFAGILAQVEKLATAHNVFDYLQDDKKKQLEMEWVVTQHLQRIGAYLAPRCNYGTISEDIQEHACLVSIIIPVYRRPEFIATAIESACQQTVKKQCEIIVVVNGGKDDPTVNIVQEFLPGGPRYQADNPTIKLVVCDINNIGLCLNLGILHSQGRYYLQLDSDDRLKSYAVEQVLEVFAQNPDAAMVIGSYEVWEKRSDGTLFRREDIPVVTHDEWTEANGRNNLLRINGAGAPRAYHIEIVKKMGWFSVNDEPYARNYGEDYDMVLKISEKYQIARIWQPIYEVVRHAGSTDHSIDKATIDRNDNAKDMMRWAAILRRQQQNKVPISEE